MKRKLIAVVKFITGNFFLIGVTVLIWWLAWSQHQHNNELQKLVRP